MTLARVAAAIVALAATPLAAQQPVFRSSVDSVVVDVSVRQGGQTVANLAAADFAVTDNGVTQTLADVSHEALPVDVTLIVDVSGSMKGPRYASLARAIDEVSAHLRPIDRATLVTFNQHIREAGALTAGLKASELLGLDPSQGATSLYDAIVSALITPLEVNRRHMAIVFTDGLDVSSLLDADDALDVAARSGVTVFSVSLSDRSLTGNASVDDVFRTLAETTGGAFTSISRNDDLSTSFLRALEEFGTSYVLRYTATGSPRQGWHEIAVRVTRAGHYEVRARKGYFGTAASQER